MGRFQFVVRLKTRPLGFGLSKNDQQGQEHHKNDKGNVRLHLWDVDGLCFHGVLFLV